MVKYEGLHYQNVKVELYVCPDVTHCQHRDVHFQMKLNVDFHHRVSFALAPAETAVVAIVTVVLAAVKLPSLSVTFPGSAFPVADVILSDVVTPAAAVVISVDVVSLVVDATFRNDATPVVSAPWHDAAIPAVAAATFPDPAILVAFSPAAVAAEAIYNVVIRSVFAVAISGVDLVAVVPATSAVAVVLSVVAATC